MVYPMSVTMDVRGPIAAALKAPLENKLRHKQYQSDVLHFSREDNRPLVETCSHVSILIKTNTQLSGW